MDHMMGGGMMWGMGLIGMLLIVVLVLAAAALIKYIFFGSSKQRSLTRVRFASGRTGQFGQFNRNDCSRRAP